MMPDVKADDDDASSVTSDKSDIPVLKPDVRVVEGFKPVPLQRPFQSGSTPQHLTNRFMVGTIIFYQVLFIEMYDFENEIVYKW